MLIDPELVARGGAAQELLVDAEVDVEDGREAVGGLDKPADGFDRPVGGFDKPVGGFDASFPPGLPSPSCPYRQH